MLTELLSLLDEGRAFSQWELAQRLGVSQDAVMAQMEYLERLGMLRRVQNDSGCKDCSGGCGGGYGCGSGSRGESAPRGPAMWEKVKNQKG